MVNVYLWRNTEMKDGVDENGAKMQGSISLVHSSSVAVYFISPR